MSLRLGPFGSPRGVGSVSYERGTAVISSSARYPCNLSPLERGTPVISERGNPVISGRGTPVISSLLSTRVQIPPSCGTLFSTVTPNRLGVTAVLFCYETLHFRLLSPWGALFCQSPNMGVRTVGGLVSDTRDRLTLLLLLFNSRA